MSKLYTLDNKLLIGTPEVRIGEKVYPVDDRTKTVKKLMALSSKGKDDVENIGEILKLAYGSNYSEIEEMNMPFAAYQQLLTITVAAMTGEDPERVDARFQKAEAK